MKFKTWQLTLASLLIAALTIFVVTALAKNGPTLAHSAQHTTQNEFWDNVRLKPVKVSGIEGNTVYWTFQDTHTIAVGSFVTDERTQFPKAFKEGKMYLVIYCEEHKVAYEFQNWK